jgi:hypothetical protein
VPSEEALSTTITSKSAPARCDAIDASEDPSTSARFLVGTTMLIAVMTPSPH